MYKFTKDQFDNFQSLDSKCFVLPNGLGGYTSTSIINSSHRKHYGYLIACLKPPVDRKLILGRINDYVKVDSTTYDLESQNYSTYIKEGYKYQEEFSYDLIPTYTYLVDGVKIVKRIAPKYNSNTVMVSYQITSEKNAQVFLEPLFNYRDHGEASRIEDLKFKVVHKNHLLVLTPEKNQDIEIKLYYSDGELVENDSPFTDGLHCEYDVSTGDKRLDHHFKPYKIKIDLEANQTKKISVICTLDRLSNKDSFFLIDKYEERMKKLIKKSRIKDSLGQDLVLAADSFITKRESTKLKTILAGLPWFTDWGRDTMIAFTGLTLVTRRFDEAKEILKSFSLYEKNGLIPNMFPDDGGEPLYNTVDASLWYFYACYKYVKYTRDYQFIKNEIYPTLKNIIKAYSTKTDFTIYMDKDSLIHAGSDQDQITWMDVRTNGVAVTPRHGKPVEINALWYNALKIMDFFSKKFLENDPSYNQLAKKVKRSFNEKFYCSETKCLYDTVDPNDKSIRPNQIWVLSLPYKVLNKKYNHEVLNTVTFHLYNVYGLRSLSNLDPRFKPKYEGELLKRDYAYHMGTTWGFLIGGYLDAYYYVNKNNEKVKEEVNELVHRFLPHLNDGCLNGIAEIFDGDVAGRTRGCYSQAWSVGELLRAYYEIVLK